MKQKKVAIIGGGVSGSTLAYLLKDKADVTIFERENLLLFKLLKTGNGKANIYNRYIKSSAYNDANFMALHAPHIEKTLDDFFANLGIITYTDGENRVYPYSRSAKGLRDILVSKLACKVQCNYNVKDVKIRKDGFEIDGVFFDYVVLATGSSAGLFKYELDNGNTELLKGLALNVTPLVPVIKTIAVKENLSLIKNTRHDVVMSLYVDSKMVFKDKGEVLFKEDGLSGIVSFVISSYLEWYYEKNKSSTYKICLDLLPEFSEEELSNLILNDCDFIKFFNPAMVNYLTKRKLKNYAKELKNLVFNPVPLNYPENTQAIHGGVSLVEISESFYLRKNERLYILGEVLNIDGICGGYNLGFAFYSANIASRSLIHKLSINH